MLLAYFEYWYESKELMLFVHIYDGHICVTYFLPACFPECALTKSILSQVESLDAYFVIRRLVPAPESSPALIPTEATPAESYPLFLRIVSPSRRNPTASSPPTTPTIPQFSVGCAVDITAPAITNSTEVLKVWLSRKWDWSTKLVFRVVISWVTVDFKACRPYYVTIAGVPSQIMSR